MAKVIDMTKDPNNPQFESALLCGHYPDGTCRLACGPIRIVIDKEEKDFMLREFARIEDKLAQWRAMGKTPDFADPAFMSFIGAPQAQP